MRSDPRRPGPGAPPGTLRIDPDAIPSQVRVIAFGRDTFVEEAVPDVGSLPAYLEKWPVTWINVDGLGDEAVIRALGELFGIHRLSLEDVLHVVQRPKMEEFDSHLFVVIRMLVRDPALRTEQVSLFLFDRCVLTFQEQPGDCLEPVRERIRHQRPRLTGSGPDYLAYALLDAVVDHYFPLLEECGERLESLQERILADPGNEVMKEIYTLRRELLLMRRSIWPLRELFQGMLRESTPHFQDETRKYLRDCADHSIQAADLVDSSRELASSLMDLYMSSVGNRMNEIMKTLTIFAALFIPLSFIAGLYGMNFDPSISRWNMPELGWTLGYPFALSLMVGVAVGLFFYFRRKRWWS